MTWNWNKNTGNEKKGQKWKYKFGKRREKIEAKKDKFIEKKLRLGEKKDKGGKCRKRENNK